ncbi:dnaK protein [Trichomonas vaginalis G3]|uniref:DnaK protein n=1 Tax=Trichomonas vaginalis (strain ATCC PRA-98 / G3) TaxID=412133 RepID=A2DML1_TRIV3|nr:HSP70 NBD domain-containing protein [Trichomonas vaginalis G3]EAY18438.1 dnaK protein [Trichomonas vaginalis G3]KAI5530283.1 HSP70 NBD domain-containing protein [Trichomonas vaginalis G3]|eukprot:XP_001579424.1 dnaK protein [Trichomonas vaginalis G3]
MNQPHLGIDLGTTYCCIFAFDEKKNIKFSIRDGDSEQIPSFVSFANEERIVGRKAMAQMITNPTNTIYDSKRMIGRNFDNQIFQEDRKNWMFTTTRGMEGSININATINNQTITLLPEEISGYILKHLKDTAELVIGNCTDVVITIPAAFNERQREKTIFAAQEIAGFRSVILLDEPSSAALEYAQGLPSNADELVLIFDFGGGTLDISIVEIFNNQCKVIATNGDPHFGGQDIDQLLVNRFRYDFETKNGIKIDQTTKEGQKAILLLKLCCENLKKELNYIIKAEFTIKSFYNNIDLYCSMNRREFRTLCSDLFKRAENLVKQSLEKAKLRPENISQVIMIGGSSQIPEIQQILQDIFDKEPLHSINALEAVARGACIQCYNLHKTNGFEKEITPNKEEVEETKPKKPSDNKEGGKEKEPKNTSHEIEEVEETKPKKPSDNKEGGKEKEPKNTSHEIEEVEETKPKKPSDNKEGGKYKPQNAIPVERIGFQIKLVETVSLSFGIRTIDDGFSVVIKSGSVIPAKFSQLYETTVDDQDTVDACIFQGESPVASQNSYIGTYRITGIPKKKAGEVMIKIILSLDRSGVFSLTPLFDDKELPYTFVKELCISDSEMKNVKDNLNLFRNQDTITEFYKLAAQLTRIESVIKRICRKEKNSNEKHVNLKERIFDLVTDTQGGNLQLMDYIRLTKEILQILEEFNTEFPNERQ